MKQYLRLGFIALLASFIFVSCGKKQEEAQGGEEKINPEEVMKTEKDFKEFATALEDSIGTLYHESSLKYWNASISGKDEDFKQSEDAQNKLNDFLANKAYYAKLDSFQTSGKIQDPIQQRRLLMLYNSFKQNQIDIEKLHAMTALQTQIEKKFNTYRAKVGKKLLTDNDVEEILKTSKNSKELQQVWEAHKEIGPIVADDIIKLVKMRNEAAKELGFNNFHEMSLILNDQNPEDVANIFDELDLLTKDAFKQVKSVIDSTLAKRYKIEPSGMMPWHYQNRYFQEAPSIYDIDMNPYYKDKDLLALTEQYYKSIGMDISDMAAKSDLYEKPGKNQHAYCIDIDRRTGDIRVLCNVVDNSGWMETLLHEFGHAVYFKYIDRSLPWSLQTPAHIFTTEAIAMMFGRFALNPKWMMDMKLIDSTEAARISGTAHKILRLQQLVFSRWSQVMYRFEKSLYENPDQDLNKLWWDLVSKYQLLKKPEGRDKPDWATKIHIATSPCYYHNYLLGELLASQLYYKIKDGILKTPEGQETSFYNSPEAGKFLMEKVFAPGAKYYWNDMIEKATGEKLTPKYYAEQFVK